MKETIEVKTCSVAEFAKIVGISRDAAYELVNSSTPPHGFRAGKAYRIIVANIDDYLDVLYQRELTSRIKNS